MSAVRTHLSPWMSYQLPWLHEFDRDDSNEAKYSGSSAQMGQIGVERSTHLSEHNSEMASNRSTRVPSKQNLF